MQHIFVCALVSFKFFFLNKGKLVQNKYDREFQFCSVLLFHHLTSEHNYHGDIASSFERFSVSFFHLFIVSLFICFTFHLFCTFTFPPFNNVFHYIHQTGTYLHPSGVLSATSDQIFEISTDDGDIK